MKSPYVIIGIGKSGLSAKNFLIASKVDVTEIYTFDEKQSADLTSWMQISQLPTGTLVVSPGVPLLHPEILKLKKLGWKVTSEINLAVRALTTEILIGITGSVAKSTVTSLIGEAVSAIDKNAFVGGNLGIPFCEYATRVLTTGNRAQYVVLELSSYQLENAENLFLDYSAITYLSANHLERYSSKEAYYSTKCEIINKTRTTCFINASSTDAVQFTKQKSSHLKYINFENSSYQSEIQNSKLMGPHNRDNVAIALEMIYQLNLPIVARERLLNFSGLAHRLESIGEFNNILFINDSKATAMDSVLVASQAALEKVGAHSTLWLILGGKDKNLPWSELATLKAYSKINVIFFGACAEIAKTGSTLEGPLFSKLSLALEYIFSNAKAGDVVLLSPGGTSLDEFKNFEDRGQFFKSSVLKNYSSK